MKHATIFVLALGLLAVVTCLVAQVPNSGLALQIVQNRKQDAALMQQYSWNSRTEIIENGKVQDIRIELVNYGPGGQLQRSLINDEPSQLPHGFLRRAIAEGQRQQLEQYVTGLRGVLDQYTLPTAGKVLDYVSQATIENVAAPDGTPLLLITGYGVVNPGDTLSLWVTANTLKTRRMQIATNYQGDAATVNATFQSLPSGLTYMSFAEVLVPDKNLSLQVQNFDYQTND